MNADQIEIRGLEVMTHIGVPDVERSEAQRLLVDITLIPRRSFDTMPDEIGSTVDYAALAGQIQDWAGERPRKLIETLADEIATRTLAGFAVREVTITLRKFILPETEYVAVRCTRALRE